MKYLNFGSIKQKSSDLANSSSPFIDQLQFVHAVIPAFAEEQR
jgi:hypothetical protein